MVKISSRIRGENFQDKAVGLLLILVGIIWFLPGWLYRVSLKSTAWFWWPLAFLADELRHAREPRLFFRRTLRSLGGWVSIIVAVATLAAFGLANVVLTPAFFHGTPPLAIIGAMLVVHWSLPPWQTLSVIAAVLTLAIAWWLDLANIAYNYGRDTGKPEIVAAAERRIGWIERLARVRLLVTIVYFAVMGGYTVLYLDSLQCWFTPPVWLRPSIVWLYGAGLEPACPAPPG